MYPAAAWSAPGDGSMYCILFCFFLPDEREHYDREDVSAEEYLLPNSYEPDVLMHLSVKESIQ